MPEPGTAADNNTLRLELPDAPLEAVSKVRRRGRGAVGPRRAGCAGCAGCVGCAVRLALPFQVLDFVYTADVSGLPGAEMDVLVLAARLGLADLADECCRRLLRALDAEGGHMASLALELLAFADQHGVRALKERALLVAVRHLREVGATLLACISRHPRPTAMPTAHSRQGPCPLAGDGVAGVAGLQAPHALARRRPARDSRQGARQVLGHNREE